MRTWPRVLTVALLAAAVWFGIGVWQRTRAGVDFEAAARAELPLALLIFLVAAGWVVVSDCIRGRR